MTLSIPALAKKIEAGFAAVAWVSLKYYQASPKWVDADDYIQTMIIAESLLANGRFDHQDLVRRYRAGRPETRLCGAAIPTCGNIDPKGQVAKLRKSPDPAYIAKDGATSGCAMKLHGITAFFPDPDELAVNVDAIIHVTHGTPEARLVGLLAVLRHRQALLGIDDPDALYHEFERSTERLKLRDGRSYPFVQAAAEKAKTALAARDPEDVLIRLVEGVGLSHLCVSAPVAAVFWSYVAHSKCKVWLDNIHPDKKLVVRGAIPVTPVEIEKSWAAHFIPSKGDPNYAWKERQDTDTFFSIAFSIAAARNSEFLDDNEKAAAQEAFGENWQELSLRLARRWEGQ